jgi:GGDEF domain-containing protein
VPAEPVPLPLAAAAFGVAGLVSGVAGVAADAPVLGLVAGVCAAAAGAAAWWLAGRPSPPPTRSSPPVIDARADTPAAGVASAASSAVEDVDVASSPSPMTDETGLFNGSFFDVAVETRISAARRHLRPVAIVLFEVVDDPKAPGRSLADPKPVVRAIQATLREADTACRLDDGRFGFVLEDTPEDGAIWTVERLRRTLSQEAPNQVRWAGIACYPAHAFNAAEATDKAERAFAAAREWPQDRIEVANAD